MSRKTDFIEAVEEVLRQQMLGLSAITENLEKAYFDNGFNTGGADAITSAETEVYGFSAESFTSAINVLVQFNNLMNNRTVTAGDWKSPINKIKKFK